MTYGLGLLCRSGLVMASDSRSNAGVDQIARVRKMATFEQPGTRAMILLSAGNLATTQSVTESLRQQLGGGSSADLFAAHTLFDGARMIGDTLRQVIDRDAHHVSPHGDAGASFLFGGQIQGMPPRLFLIYPAGNFIEASDRCPYLQIGENKYGKPILDRAFAYDKDLAEGCKLALLSFDATMRSNLSVAPPIDLVRYRADSLAVPPIFEFDRSDAYFQNLTQRYAEGLTELVGSLPKLTT